MSTRGDTTSAPPAAPSSRWETPARAYAVALLEPAAVAAAVRDALDLLDRHGDRPVADGTALTVVRDAVARRVPRPAPAPAQRTGLFRRSAPPRACSQMPELLAARGASRLSPIDVERVAVHLDSCPVCDALERRMAEAERAFRRDAARAGKPTAVAAPADAVAEPNTRTAPAREPAIEPEPQPAHARTASAWLPDHLRAAGADDDITVSRGAGAADALVPASTWLIEPTASPRTVAPAPAAGSPDDWIVSDSERAAAIPTPPPGGARRGGRSGSRALRFAAPAFLLALVTAGALAATGTVDLASDDQASTQPARKPPPAESDASRSSVGSRTPLTSTADRRQTVRRRAAARRKAADRRRAAATPRRPTAPPRPPAPAPTATPAPAPPRPHTRARAATCAHRSDPIAAQAAAHSTPGDRRAQAVPPVLRARPPAASELISRRPRMLVALGAPLLVGVAGSLIVVGSGGATSLPARTLLVSASATGGLSDGSSQNPVLSTTGRVVAFDTTGSNLGVPDENGPVRDIFAVDLVSGERRLVSAPSAGTSADGPSSIPVMSRDGQRVVFVSEATNLVAGDANGAADVFYRDGRGPIERVTVGLGGTDPNGASSQPDVSADGRFVVFTSTASNLVRGDTNGQPDVFMRDLAERYTVRVSVSSRGMQANGPADTPAISANGRVISFYSRASNLVQRDTNRVGDVFVRVPGSRRTERVSVSTRGRQQNRAVIAPFTQVSDLNRDGRVVVFESDATNLVRPDTNRHTDVFRHDRHTGRTTLISVDSFGFQGNNDSFAPRMTPNARFVSFQSFSTNLAPGHGAREDIFLRDLVQGTTSVVNVPATGGTRAPELVGQLLQRPSISNNGTIAAFSSTAPNLVDGDVNRVQDVFVRLLAPPSGRTTRRPRAGRRPVIYIGADDPRATNFVCRVDALTPFACRAGAVRLPRGLSPGRHTVRVRAGGPGMLYDPLALRIRVRVTRSR